MEKLNEQIIANINFVAKSQQQQWARFQDMTNGLLLVNQQITDTNQKLCIDNLATSNAFVQNLLSGEDPVKTFNKLHSSNISNLKSWQNSMEIHSLEIRSTLEGRRNMALESQKNDIASVKEATLPSIVQVEQKNDCHSQQTENKDVTHDLLSVGKQIADTNQKLFTDNLATSNAFWKNVLSGKDPVKILNELHQSNISNLESWRNSLEGHSENIRSILEEGINMVLKSQQQQTASVMNNLQEANIPSMISKETNNGDNCQTEYKDEDDNLLSINQKMADTNQKLFTDNLATFNDFVQNVLSGKDPVNTFNELNKNNISNFERWRISMEKYSLKVRSIVEEGINKAVESQQKQIASVMNNGNGSLLQPLQFKCFTDCLLTFNRLMFAATKKSFNCLTSFKPNVNKTRLLKKFVRSDFIEKICTFIAFCFLITGSQSKLDNLTASVHQLVGVLKDYTQRGVTDKFIVFVLLGSLVAMCYVFKYLTICLFIASGLFVVHKFL